MTLDTKEELLLTMLLFGLRLLDGSLESLPLITVNAVLPSPNTGVFRPSSGDEAMPLAPYEPTSLVWLFVSCGDSCMLGGTCDRVLVRVPNLWSCDCEGWRGARATSESFVPVVGGDTVVARGFGLWMGASDGCGGGVARWRSSRNT